MPRNTLPWHKRYHRDWLISERRAAMSLAERGLYMDLLDRHYADGSIPADETTLARLTGVSLAEFRRAWKRVQREFEPDASLPGRLIQPEVLEELAATDIYVCQQVEKGRKGGRQKKAATKPRLSNGLTSEEQRLSHIEPELELEPEHKEQTPTPCPPDGERRAHFDVFWTQYPRKVAKHDARKAFDSVIKTASDQQRLVETGPAWVAEFESREPDKVPYPATFLRKGQWAEPPPKGRAKTASLSERAEQRYQELEDLREQARARGDG